MKKQPWTCTAYLVAASLFGTPRSCRDTGANNQGLAFQQISEANDSYLPSGFYDALENPISEDEYWRQIEYEQQSGIPYARDRNAERANFNNPVSLLAHPEIEYADNPDAATHITEQGICYEGAKGQSIFVNSLPSNCEVVTFTDERCRDNPLDVIPFLNAVGGG